MGRTRYIKYKGTNKNLVSGESYTYKQYAKVAGVSVRCFMGRAVHKQVVTDNELKPLCKDKIPRAWRNVADLDQSRFEHPCEALSGKYLKIKL
jgi:hypothetical protein